MLEVVLFALRENFDANWVTLFIGFKPDLAVDERRDRPSDGGGLWTRDDDVPGMVVFAMQSEQR